MSAIAMTMPTRRDPRAAALAARSHLRMTRRGRAVLLGLVATPLVVIALVAGINAGGATATGSAPLATVTVTSGETLWQVATQVAPKADPRDVIADILSVNTLASSDLQPGEKLRIPAKYSH
jgi:Tfp pilus assembly protein FimV